jgi:hypothetical protein
MLDRHKEASSIDATSTEVLRKLGESNPAITAHFCHDLAADLRSIGFQDEALLAEESAVALYLQVPEVKLGLFRNFIYALESLRRNLRALAREEDAAEVEAEVAILNGRLTQESGPLAHATESPR